MFTSIRHQSKYMVCSGAEEPLAYFRPFIYERLLPDTYLAAASHIPLRARQTGVEHRQRHPLLGLLLIISVHINREQCSEDLG